MNLASDVPRQTGTPLLVLLPCCALLFLMLLALGAPTQTDGLDPAWTEVQAWAFLNRVQWGPDLINTYGPLGFLHPLSAYVSGIFVPFVAGQIALGIAFVSVVALFFRRAPVGEFALFMLAAVCCAWRLPGAASWLLMLPFATAALIERRSARLPRLVAIAACSLLIAAVVLVKFSAFPLAVLCLAAATAAGIAPRDRLLLALPASTLAALAALWVACGQDLRHLPQFIVRSLELAHGYRHAQGQDAPMPVLLLGFGVLAAFGAGCALVIRRARTHRGAMLTAALAAATAGLFWSAYFTRADEFHWPAFFAVMTLLPFLVLRTRAAWQDRRLVALLACVVVGGIVGGFLRQPPLADMRLLARRAAANAHDLLHLAALHEQREASWNAARISAELPRIRARVGAARIDVITWQQESILLNGLTYAPRPVFQSHLAATAELTRINEAFFLGARAPAFVLLELAAVDQRLPASEDNLALLALLRRYRPVMLERGFLLLALDAAVATPEPIEAGANWIDGALGAPIALEQGTEPTLAFVQVRMNVLGLIYSLLLPEPELTIALATADGALSRHRFVRLSAPAGIVVDPRLESDDDWLRLYYRKSLPRFATMSIAPAHAWQRVLYDARIRVASRRLPILHGEANDMPAEFVRSLFPGFTDAPLAPADPPTFREEGVRSVFLHAPATLTFEPKPDLYRISLSFGVQARALTEPGCRIARADGIAVALFQVRGTSRTLLAHAAINPFAVPADRGAQRLVVHDVRIAAGDRIEYRVDPGEAGNTGCDWSFVRDVVFRPTRAAAARPDDGRGIFEDDFE